MINNSGAPKITLTLLEEGKAIRQLRKNGKVRFFIEREATKWLKVGRSWGVRVTYGYGANVHGKRVLFQNSGTYDNVEDLKWAYRAFYKEYSTT